MIVNVRPNALSHYSLFSKILASCEVNFIKFRSYFHNVALKLGMLWFRGGPIDSSFEASCRFTRCVNGMVRKLLREHCGCVLILGVWIVVTRFYFWRCVSRTEWNVTDERDIACSKADRWLRRSIETGSFGIAPGFYEFCNCIAWKTSNVIIVRLKRRAAL